MKMNKKMIINIAVVILLLFIVFLIFNKLFSGKDEDNNNNNNNNTNVEVDFNKVIGFYVSEQGKSVDDIKTGGGHILDITSVDEQSMVFNIEHVSEIGQTAVLSEHSIITPVEIKKNSYTYDWIDDGWDSRGTVTVELEGENVYLTISSTLAKGNTAGWSLGNMERQKFYKVN